MVKIKRIDPHQHYEELDVTKKEAEEKIATGKYAYLKESSKSEKKETEKDEKES